MSNSVEFNLELAVQNFTSAINTATKQADAFSKKTTAGFGTIQSSFAVMAGSLAAGAFTSFAKSVVGSLNSVIDEAAGSEDAINNLNIALRQAGIYTEGSSRSFQEFAGQLQAITIYGDEAILSSASLLLTLTELDKDGVQAATRAAADLAATLNIDLASATDMIAKAINGNVIAFKKIGIEIDKGDTDAQRLTNTLAALSRQQGAAVAATNTYTGAQAKANNQQSESLEAIGKLITQNPLVIAGINAKAKAYEGLANWITSNTQFLNDLGATVAITVGIIATGTVAFYAASTALAVLATGAAFGVSGFGLLGIAAGAAWAAITGPVGLAIAGVIALGTAVYGVVKYWSDIKAGAYDALAATLEFSAKAVGVFSEERAAGIRAQAQAWRDTADGIRTAAAAAKQAEGESAADAQARKIRNEELNRINANKVETARINAANLNAIDRDRALQEQAILTEAEQAKAETQLNFDALKIEQTAATREQELLARQEYEQQLLDIQIAAELNKAKLESDAQTRSDAIKNINDKANLDRAKLNSKQEVDLLKLRVKSEQEINANRAKNQADTFATIATMSNSSNKELALIGKAAGIAQIAIATPVAISKALAAFPPPYSFVAAGLVGTAMAAQAANIAGVKFADGGIVPGSNMTGDRIAAQLNSGEMVLNKTQQSNLFKLANTQPQASIQDTSRVESLLSTLVDLFASGTSININGKEIINVIRDEMASGRKFA